jgi:signal transduction histidine kinase
MVNRNAKRLLNLVNQLMDFRKMEHQELKLYNSPGDIIGFIKDLSYGRLRMWPSKKVSICF